MTARRALKLVSPDLAQMEAVVVEAAEQQFPVANRQLTMRGEMAARLRKLDNEEREIEDRQLLARRLFEADDEEFNRQLDDVREAKAVLMRGLQPL